MKIRYFDKFVIVLILFLIGFAAFLQVLTVKSTDRLKTKELKLSEQYASQIATLIQTKTNYDIESALTQNEALRGQINEILHAFLTQRYQYIFVLKKDEKNKYRFLLDASLSDQEEYHALFFPQSHLYDKVYRTGKMQIVKQKKGAEKVWLSLVYPIQKEEQTEALLVLDLSENYGTYLTRFHSPLIRILTWMQFFLIVSLILLIIFGYRYYKTRKALIYDKLTEMYTKYYLTELFDKERLDEYHALLIDIDEFKDINKKFGLAFGDKVIQEFALFMQENLPSSSRFVRIGGTEFLVTVPKKEGSIETLSQNLFNTLQAQQYTINNEKIKLSVSMSAIEVPEETLSVHIIQRFLDEKMLEIKNRGKNALGIIGKKNIDDVKYTNIDYIKDALEQERLICLYQPIYYTKTKEVIKYEALVRLIDEENPNKLIPPFYFMDVIKGTSQYIKMSKLVFGHVFDTLQKYPKIELSVNVDLDDLDNDDMMHMIRDNLSKYKEIANRLTFEILEEHEIRDYDKVQDIFNQLKAYGSKIALDDFGSGYASYGYLIRLDIDILKIDGTLIKELRNTPKRAQEVIKSIQELANKFGYDVVAEFVSHEDIYEMVNSLDIEFSQGYYLGEPGTIESYLS